MKKVLTKIGYMAFGSLLTLIGYHFGNIDNNTANAQQALEKTENIVDKLRVRQLEIVGNDNSPRIYLGTNLDKGQIVVVDDNDVPHLTLKTNSEGGRIDVQDDLGKNRLKLSVDKDGSGDIRVLGDNSDSVILLGSAASKRGGVIQFNDSLGKGRVILGVTTQDVGGIRFLGDNSETLVGIGSFKGDGGFVAVGPEHENEDEVGMVNPSVMLRATPDKGLVAVENKTGKKYVALVAKDADAYLGIEDDENLNTMINMDSITIRNLKTENLIFASGANPLGEGYVLIFDKNGTPVQAMGNTGKSTQVIEYEETIRRSETIGPLRRKRTQ